MKKHFTLFLYLLIVTNPYQGPGIDWDQEEPQLYEYQDKKTYSIKTYGPEEENPVLREEETAFSEEETQRFINKVNKIINYSPYVYR